MSEAALILVVEDDYPLQGIVEEAITEGGFETDILSSGEEALTLFRGGTKDYKALVTDVRLKGKISGWEVARQVREIDPGCPVIYITGAAADERRHQRHLADEHHRHANTASRCWRAHADGRSTELVQHDQHRWRRA